MKTVKSIGQGFADEIFRLFRRQSPGTRIRVENTVPVLASMINHVVDNKIE